MEPALLDRHGHGAAGEELAGQDRLSNRRFQLPLDRPLQGPGAIDRVVARLGQPIEGLLAEDEAELALL